MRPKSHSGGTGTLVETGSFRVAAKRALEKLARFQLQDPGFYVLLLVRCAAACGASYIRFKRWGYWHGVDIRFDGRPFTGRELRDPYSALFEEGGRALDRRRQLARALLAMLQLKPEWMSVASGSGEDRRRLRASVLGSERLEPAPNDPGETVILAHRPLGLMRKLWNTRLADVLERDCALAPLGIYADGRMLRFRGWKDRALPSSPVSGHGMRGDVYFPWLSAGEPMAVRGAVGSSPGAKIELYRYGVYAGTASFRDMPCVAGQVDYEALGLNASQTRFVRDEALKKVRSAVRKTADRLLSQALETHSGRMPDLARRLAKSRALRGVWSRALSTSPPDFTKVWRVFAKHREPRSMGSRWTVREIKEDILRLGWLREAARRLVPRNRGRKIRDPLAKALWETDLFLTIDLSPISLAELERQSRRIKFIPYGSVGYDRSRFDYRLVWLEFKDMADDLKAWFGKRNVHSLTLPRRLRRKRRRRRGSKRSKDRGRPSGRNLPRTRLKGVRGGQRRGGRPPRGR